MAGATHDEALASSSCHQLRPAGLWLSQSVEIGESADVVHRNAVRFLADFASVRQEPGDQLLVANDPWDWNAVADDRVPLRS